MNKSRLLSAILQISLLLVFYSCGGRIIGSPASPATKTTVLGVSADYLGKIVRGNYKEVNAMVVWPTYLDKSGPGMTKEKYFTQLDTMRKRWKTAQTNHPLLGLTPVSVDVDGDEAEVVLKKEKSSEMSPEIEIQLSWAGTGWMISGDSLFGDNGMFSQTQ